MDPFSSALEQAAAVRRGEVSATELVRMYLDRIESHNPALNAHWLVTPELALEQTNRAGRERCGPLSGAPVSVKDNVTMAGYPTTYGSRAFADFVADVDQFSVARLKEAGCPILGRRRFRSSLAGRTPCIVPAREAVSYHRPGCALAAGTALPLRPRPDAQDDGRQLRQA